MWNNDLAMDVEVANQCISSVGRAVENGLPHVFANSGVLLLPSQTRCESVRMVQLAKRANQDETPTFAAIYRFGATADLIAILVSETVAAQISNPQFSWEQRLEHLSKGIAPFVNPVLFALGFDVASEPDFVFDMHAVAIQTIATIVGNNRHSAVMITSQLNGFDGDGRIQIIILTSQEQLDQRSQPGLAEAA